jgi:uncharacterized protein YnzC (UPF0291/DUF896 family)
MTSEVFSLLLDKRISELNGKAVESCLSKVERAELRALEAHYDKAPAVAHRIRILTSKMAQSSRIKLFFIRFSKKCRQNLAELEALLQYGNSKAVWEIAYLTRKKASGALTEADIKELKLLVLYHDSPEVLRITRLKLKAEAEPLTTEESQELAAIQRNPYRQGGVPQQLLEMLWPTQGSSVAEPLMLHHLQA